MRRTVHDRRLARSAERSAERPNPLFIPELLLEVLRFVYVWNGFEMVDFTDINSAGLVCKPWTGPSLVVKWESCPFIVLFSKLAPFESTPKGWVS